MGIVAAFWAAFIVFVLGLAFYGLYLAFSASLILGVIVLIVEPLPLVLGLVGFLGHPEVAHKIAQWLGM